MGALLRRADYKPPEARTAEEAAAADAYEASRTGEEREAFGVALSSMQIWRAPMLTAFLTRMLPEVMRASPDMRRWGALANSPLLTPCLLTPPPSPLSVVGQLRIVVGRARQGEHRVLAAHL